MTEGPIRIGSFLNYQIVIFLLVIIWAFMGFEVAQFQLLPLYETPFIWIAWAVFVLVSIIPAITAVTWRMKTQIVFIEPVWDLREREVSLSEYREMMKQYRSEYRDFLSIVDYNLILLALIISVMAVAAPFLLMRTTIILIAATPVIFGIFVLFFGLACSSITFKFIPNDATPHFPIVSEKSLHSSVKLMESAPGISWSGVNLSLGEASGYYTVRNTTPVSRIEGIESAAKIQGITDESGYIIKTVAMLTLDNSDTPKVIDESSGETYPKQITEMVHKILLAYIEAKGADEILDEVLEEVTHFLKRFEAEGASESS
ncbi:MAG: hypothetical protein ThorAB25_02410 [Candidatus Thorarchaeota archaeon AB_25]|nr:MAG: hypothetical protein ThorAB25_02410 [Candidatus Thorarchaeota archaeon AB_25]